MPEIFLADSLLLSRLPSESLPPRVSPDICHRVYLPFAHNDIDRHTQVVARSVWLCALNHVHLRPLPPWSDDQPNRNVVQNTEDVFADCCDDVCHTTSVRRAVEVEANAVAVQPRNSDDSGFAVQSLRGIETLRVHVGTVLEDLHVSSRHHLGHIDDDFGELHLLQQVHQVIRLLVWNRRVENQCDERAIVTRDVDAASPRTIIDTFDICNLQVLPHRVLHRSSSYRDS